MSRADQILVELAIRNHLISEAEGQECLSAVAAEPGVDVGTILVRKKYIKERHLKSLQKKQQKMLEKEGNVTQIQEAPAAQPPQQMMQSAETDATFIAPDPGSSPLLSGMGSLVLFGQIAISKNMVSETDLERGLRLQEQLAAQKNPMRIGQILVRAQRMSTNQVAEVLAYQSKWIFVCSVCGRRYNVSTSLEAALQCGQCGGNLVQASSSSVHVDATHGATSDSGLKPMTMGSSAAAAQSSDERGAPTPDDPGGLLNRTWKGYHVEKILGKGGMGAVYKAVQTSLRREVALKVMLRRPGMTPSQEERERFEREAKLIGNLVHPNIVKIIDAEWNEDLCWFTMEMVPGQDFKATLRSGTFPMGKGAAVVAKVCRAMDFAHQKGIIHRDLKPQNIMIDEESEEPKVLDFGLAKNVDQSNMQQLTQMGAFLGTPAYMAPEQAGGDPNAIDARADVYAMGAILYEVLTGRPPFTGKKAIQVIRKVLKEDPVPPQQVFAHADPRLSAIALRALAKVPDDRYQTCGQMADDIEQVIGKVSRAYTPSNLGVTPSGSSSSDASDPSSQTEEKKKSSFFGRLFGG